MMSDSSPKRIDTLFGGSTILGIQRFLCNAPDYCRLGGGVRGPASAVACRTHCQRWRQSVAAPALSHATVSSRSLKALVEYSAGTFVLLGRAIGRLLMRKAPTIRLVMEVVTSALA